MQVFLLLPEQRLQALEMNIPACEINKCSVCEDALKTLHEYMLWLHVCDDVDASVRQLQKCKLLVWYTLGLRKTEREREREREKREKGKEKLKA